MAHSSRGYVLLRRGQTTAETGSGDLAKPGSGATITLWASNSNVNSTYAGARWKRLIVNLYVSHASVASGLVFAESQDGTNYRTLVAYTVAATTYTKNTVSVSAPYIKITYQNDTNVLTTWEMSVLGDSEEAV